MLIYKWKKLSSKARRADSTQTFGMGDDITGLARPFLGNEKEEERNTERIIVKGDRVLRRQAEMKKRLVSFSF